MTATEEEIREYELLSLECAYAALVAWRNERSLRADRARVEAERDRLREELEANRSLRADRGGKG